MTGQPKEVGTEEMCEHMIAMVKERGYVRDPETGHYLLKMCLAPTREVFRDICGKLLPISAEGCRTCNGNREFGPPPENVKELNSCHYRCPRCKCVTKGCDTKACANCGAINLTLLPPVINVDAYGFNVANP